MIALLNNKKFVFLLRLVIGLLISYAIMCMRGVHQSGISTADRIKIISDGFTVMGFFYICLGGLYWAATTGFMDAVAYTLRKIPRQFIPIIKDDDLTSFYDYKLMKEDSRKNKTRTSTLSVGILITVIAAIFTVIWYKLQ